MLHRIGRIALSGPAASTCVAALFLAACSDAPPPPPAGSPARGEVIALVPDAVRAVGRDGEDGCDYSWLSLSGRVQGDVTTVFMPIRRNLGNEPRCQPKIANEMAMLVEAEIADGDDEPVLLCAKKRLETAYVEVPENGRRYEAIELLVSGFYFRKEVFWSCNDEPGCWPPPSCEILATGGT